MNACDISAPLCAIALKPVRMPYQNSPLYPRVCTLWRLRVPVHPRGKLPPEIGACSRGRSITLTDPLFTSGTPCILGPRLLILAVPQELQQSEHVLVPYKDRKTA